MKRFLTQAKNALSTSVHSRGQQAASFVIGNESADLDSIACALLYGYIYSNTSEARQADKCIVPVTNIPASELRLRPELGALLKHVDIRPGDLITLDDLGPLQESLPASKTEWTLVDHNVFLSDLGEHYSYRVTGVIDHHEDEGKVSTDASPRIIEKAGSCCSLVTNHCREAWDAISQSSSQISPQLAKLALGPILIDTVNLTADFKVTPHDIKAVEYLEAIIDNTSSNNIFDRNAFFEELNAAKSDVSALTLEEILRKDYKQWTERELVLGISASVRSIEYLRTKEDRAMDEMFEFARERKCDVYAVMTAHNDEGDFARELLLMVCSEEGKLAVEKFVDTSADELKLRESEQVWSREARTSHFWRQENLDASRKQVAPMLRKAMG